MGDPAQGLREKIRVTRPGGTVSAIACFCHSGNLPRYNGRYLATGNQRIDQLDLKLNRAFRLTVRPELLGVDHSVLSLDLLWQFKDAGLQDVQINGHLTLVSPGDARIPIEEGATYALTRRKIELDGLSQTREKHGEQLALDGFSQVEFDELIALKRAQHEYLEENPAHVREMMEVFSQPLLIIRGTRPLRS